MFGIHSDTNRLSIESRLGRAPIETAMMKLIPISITNLQISGDAQTISWSHGSASITKSYRFAVACANVLIDGHGVAVVESIEESGPRNAVVLNGDGSERFRVMSPLPDFETQGFADMYYVNGELTAILVSPGRDFAVVIDENKGRCLRFYETR